jgi:hypothetical protein
VGAKDEVDQEKSCETETEKEDEEEDEEEDAEMEEKVENEPNENYKEHANHPVTAEQDERSSRKICPDANKVLLELGA